MTGSEDLHEELIAAVEKREWLYDKAHSNYFNRSFINKQWTEIGYELGVDPNIARKKWTTLRDYFQRCHIQLISPMVDGSEPKRKRKWYLYDRMNFLRPHVKERKSWTSEDPKPLSKNGDDPFEEGGLIPISKTSPHSSERSFSMNVNEESRHMDETLSQASSLSDDFKPVFKKKRKKVKAKRSFEENATTASIAPPPVEDNCYFETISQPNGDEQSPKDETSLFLDSLAPYMRTFSPIIRIECQAEMQMLLLRFMRRNNQEDPSASNNVNEESDNDNDNDDDDYDNDDATKPPSPSDDGPSSPRPKRRHVH